MVRQSMQAMILNHALIQYNLLLIAHAFFVILMLVVVGNFHSHLQRHFIGLLEILQVPIVNVAN